MLCLQDNISGEWSYLQTSLRIQPLLHEQKNGRHAISPWIIRALHRLSRDSKHTDTAKEKTQKLSFFPFWPRHANQVQTHSIVTADSSPRGKTNWCKVKEYGLKVSTPNFQIKRLPNKKEPNQHRAQSPYLFVLTNLLVLSKAKTFQRVKKDSGLHWPIGDTV